MQDRLFDRYITIHVIICSKKCKIPFKRVKIFETSSPMLEFMHYYTHRSKMEICNLFKKIFKNVIHFYWFISKKLEKCGIIWYLLKWSRIDQIVLKMSSVDKRLQQSGKFIMSIPLCQLNWSSSKVCSSIWIFG